MTWLGIIIELNNNGYRYWGIIKGGALWKAGVGSLNRVDMVWNEAKNPEWGKNIQDAFQNKRDWAKIETTGALFW